MQRFIASSVPRWRGRPFSTDATRLFALLDLQASSSRKQPDSELHCLENVKSTRSWDYSLPTLVNTSSKRKVNRHLNQTEDFKTLFYKQFPRLAKVDMSNLIIMGGSIVDLLLDTPPKDIDFFIYGLTKEEVVQRLQKFLSNLLAIEQQYSSDLKKFRAIRRGHNITVFSSAASCPIQISLVACPSIGEYLYLNDHSCSAIAFDGNRTYMTPLCKFSLETMCTVVDPSFNWSHSYENRLRKYFKLKGFDLILPHFDISKLTNPYATYNAKLVLELPRILLRYGEVKENKIITDELFVNPSEKKEHSEPWSSPIPPDPPRLKFTNVATLARGDEDFYFVGAGERILEALSMSAQLTAHNIDEVYSEVVGQVFKDQSLNFNVLSKFYPLIDPTVCTHLYLQYVTDKKLIPDLIENITKKQKISVREKLENFQSKVIDSTLTVCTTTELEMERKLEQIFTHASEWYGSYYKPAGSTSSGSTSTNPSTSTGEEYLIYTQKKKRVSL